MELLSAEAFQALITMYEQQCAVDILRTEPHELKRREQIYAAYLGFEGFLALTRKFADAAQANAKPTTVETTPDRSDDPSVHDIYYRNESN